MTREEAIEVMKWFRRGIGLNDDLQQALDMAIEALSADAPKGDLINRQWLLELYGDYIGDNGEPKYHVPLEVVRQNIKDAPSADRPSVVRCKDCKWWHDNIGYSVSYCPYDDIGTPDADDYCSYGERKEL